MPQATASAAQRLAGASAPARAGRGRPRLRALVLAVAVSAALALVVQTHAAGASLLAVVLLALTALAAWAWGSERATAWRYLFPALAASALFVAFPVAYTVAIGFTNASSSHLLDAAQARAVLLGESVPVAGSRRPFTLHRHAAGRDGGGGDPPRWRIVLPASDGQPALATAPFESPAPRLAAADGDDADPRAAPPAPQHVLPLHPLAGDAAAALGPAIGARERVAWIAPLRTLALRLPDGSERVFARFDAVEQRMRRYDAAPDGALVDRIDGRRWRADAATGFFTAEDGATLAPGWRVAVGTAHYQRLWRDERLREPLLSIFGWTVAFAALSVAGAAGLGLVLAVILSWPSLRGARAYRLVLFLPYAVPAFISILVFKGLFNQNLGEVNFILHGLFGIRPAWFSDPTLARAMLLIVNVWLGFPYMMMLCTGLLQSIPADLYEAAAVEGSNGWTDFRAITAPLILRPLAPLLISAFAFNFNNFVLVSLLTNGRPDRLDTALPAGTTDLLVSYTWRIAFQDSGQQFGLAAAISTVIFALVAALTLLQLHAARRAARDERR